MTREEALTALAEIGSHGALGPAEANQLMDAFGLPQIIVPVTKANTHFKGYNDPNLAVGQEIAVMSGCDFAETLAAKLGFGGSAFMGRGPRFRAALDYLRSLQVTA